MVDGASLAVCFERFEILARLKGDRPVDEPDIHVRGAELGEGSVEVSFAQLGSVRVVPQLGDDGDVLARYAGLGNPVSDLRVRPA